MSTTELVILLVIGLLAGFTGGALGLGGGIIIVPALVFIMGLTQHQAQGTSLAVIVFPVAILGAYNYYKSDFINYKYVIVLALAFFVGSYLGSLMSINLPEKLLKKVFGFAMLVLSVKMIFAK
ncbi:MAG: sulfite exporter TauE/SafE family protein [Tenuifilaceae bacterium]|nr:sulfite exporter TauE/SafE family protein [Tenuifilaceae bacterium]